MMEKQKGSWQQAGKWYANLVGNKGHYFHSHVVIPGTLKLLDLKPGDKLIELGAGNGVLVSYLPKQMSYTGVEVARSLVSEAEKLHRAKEIKFICADAAGTGEWGGPFNKGVIILALQNMKEPEKVLTNLSRNLIANGVAIVVLNHPCFRIPRQSSWETDVQNKQQYRRINRYMTPLEIPVQIHPGQAKSPMTWDFHYPLSVWVEMIKKAGMYIEELEEWVSDKQSVGKAAKSENRARSEFPLFLALKLRRR